MATKKQPQDNNGQKIQTKYDRKMEERRKREEKDKREVKLLRISAITVGIVIAAAIIGSVAVSVLNKNAAIKSTYVTIGDHAITKLEYDYYFNGVVNNYVNTYSSYLSFMGLDTTKDLDKQQYDESTTWKDYFDRSAVEQIKQIKTMADDAAAKGFEYDTTEDYANMVSSIKAGAESGGVTVGEYYRSIYGSYANEKNMETFIKEGSYVSAYYTSLIEQNKPADQEVKDYYNDNVQDYDKVDYRSFIVKADITGAEASAPEAGGASETAAPEAGAAEETAAQEAGAAEETAAPEAGAASEASAPEAGTAAETAAQPAAEPTEEEINKAMAEAKKKADAMLKARQGGEDFKALCLANAAEGEKASYEDEETDASLTEGAYYASTPAAISGWLYEDKRAENDITVIEDTTGNQYYVVEFISRYYDEADNEKISNTISGSRTQEYLNGLMEAYKVVDNTGDLKYLLIESSAAEESTEETSAAEPSDE